jgi:hypothetical protein
VKLEKFLVLIDRANRAYRTGKYENAVNYANSVLEMLGVLSIIVENESGGVKH